MDYRDAERSAVRDAFCGNLGAAATGALIFTGLLSGTVVGGIVAGAAAAGATLAYNRYCNRPLPEDAFPQPQFTGGQCDAEYTVSVTWSSTLNGNPFDTQTNTITNVRGAVKRIERFTSGSTVGLRLVGGQSGNPGGITYYSVITYGNGIPNGFDFSSFVINSVTRNGGGADNCGNPPSQIPVIEPGDNVVNTDVTYVNNEGDTITVPIVLAFGYASVNVDGRLEIPVNIQADLEVPVNVDATLDLETGDLNINFGDSTLPPGGSYGCNAPTIPDPDIPDLPPDLPPSNPLDPGEPASPERRKILRGCIVTTTVIGGKETVIFEDSNPDIYAPALGYINFLVQSGNKTAWTGDIPVKNVRQIIECPWPEGAIQVAGTPRFNNEFQITPIYIQQSVLPQFPS